MIQALGEQSILLLSLETGGVLAILFCIRHFIKSRIAALQAHRAQLETAKAKAHEFLNETVSARKSYIDNHCVENWVAHYSDAFKTLSLLQAKLDDNTLSICNLYETLHAHVTEWNTTFIASESTAHDKLFGRLDSRQREACIADEVATLVVAGAGSGKTSTIQKKVEYLIRVKGVAPEDILLLSFTNKAADEMTARLTESLPDTPIFASTFHKFGLEIVKAHRAGNYDISDPHLCANTIINAISPEALNDEECRGLLRFFAFCINSEPANPNAFKTFGEYIHANRHCDLQTLHGIVDDRPADKTTFHGELVKSIEELKIANWLFLNGIRYEYEKRYDKPIPEENGKRYRVYKPDFYLPGYDIWIEHFGIDKNGEPPSYYSTAERIDYKDQILWKRKLHETNGTALVESYSWWNQEGRLTENLWTALQAHGVKRHGIDPKPVWKLLLNSPKGALVREFAKLVSAFISLAKSNQIHSESLGEVLKRGNLDEITRNRVQEFLRQVQPLYKKYESKLASENAIDFHDMINEAAQYVTNDPSSVHKYRYIVIDEFQDISTSRANLIKTIISATGAKLFCVGDDWQSIYRFAGSDITIFTHFDKHFGFTRTIRLENTYRNSQELLTVAGAFVMKNRQQLQKDLKSTRHCDRPIVCIPYKGDPEYESALYTALNDIACETNGAEASVLLLGRHNADSLLLRNATEITSDETRENFRWHPHRELKIRYMTVHKAKGLEADYVILLNFKDDLLGFPNSIACDPILELLLSEKEDLAFAEERRVFYVALTRTKNRVYILTPQKGASVFLDELPPELTASACPDANSLVSCPKCQTGHLIIRRAKSADQNSFYGCSNFPHCDYTLPLQRIPITADTPRCSCRGFLVPVRNPHNGSTFIGCTEFARLPSYPHVRRKIAKHQPH